MTAARQKKPIKTLQKVTISQATKVQVGILALLTWAVLGLTGNLGPNSFLLMFSSVSSERVLLTWTAPGDDGNTAGTTATTYDVRYSTSQITESNWASATQIVGEPAPAVAGTLQSMTISGLTAGTQYFFAIKSVDEANNWSNLSNLASVTLTSDTPPATGGDTNCSANWSCTTWSDCSNGTKSRLCTDSNNCNNVSNRPQTSQLCTCQPSWLCQPWSECKDNQQTRVCNDTAKCSGDIFQPIMIQSCGAITDKTDSGSSDTPPLQPPSGTSPGNYYAGELLKTKSSSAVYYIGSDFKLYVFPDAKTYFSWFSNFDPVIEVPVSELDKYATGGAMTIKPGTALVTTPDTNKVYAVVGRNLLYWIPSEETAATLFGPDWKYKVEDLIPGYFASTYKQTGLALTQYEQGTLLKFNNNYYLVGREGELRKFTGNGLTANGYNINYAIEIKSLPSLASGADIAGLEADLYYLR